MGVVWVLCGCGCRCRCRCGLVVVWVWCRCGVGTLLFLIGVWIGRGEGGRSVRSAAVGMVLHYIYHSKMCVAHYFYTLSEKHVFMYQKHFFSHKSYTFLLVNIFGDTTHI